MKAKCVLRPGWSPLSTGLMVLGFIVFWPLGLAMLAYILWGDEIKAMFDELTHQFRARQASGNWSTTSSNSAFEDYRQQELKRLEEERRRLDEMRAEFDEFLRELRRAKDQEEFERFMKNRTSSARDNKGDDKGAAPQGAPA